MKSRILLLGAGLCAAAASMGWAQEPPPPEAHGITRDETKASEAARQDASQRPATETPEAQMTEAKARERLKTVVSLSFTNADLRNVLSGLAKTYGLNIIVDDQVKGTVNLTLKGVPLEAALKQILQLNGYTSVWEDSILRVVSREEATATEILYLNFIQPDIALEFLRGEASESGVMKIDETQNGLLVTDRLSSLERMKAVLEKIDVPPQQVLIEAKLLDITHTDLDNLGLKLASGATNFQLRSGGVERQVNVSSGALDLSGPTSDLSTDTFSAVISRGADTVTATIDALIRHRRVKVLASPTVATLNNVEAKITIGEKFPVRETTQTTTGTLETTRFVDVGVTLRVTPKINQNGYIQMKVHPEVSSVSATLTEGPRITTREADTSVIIKEGESVVIAGLIQEDETLIRDRIPLLGHIPFLGLLFQDRGKDYEQKELVVIITPHLLPVIPPQVALGSELEEARQRLDVIQLYFEAADFESGKTLQARQTPERLRIRRAAELYETLARQYPESDLAPEALWRAGELAWTKLRDPVWAHTSFSRLVTGYPADPYAKSGQRRLKEVRPFLSRSSRRSPPPEAEQAAQTTNPFAPPKFR